MIFLLLLCLFVLKFHEAHGYLDYLIGVVFLLLLFSAAVTLFTALRLNASLTVKDGRYHEGEDVSLLFTVDAPFFHSQLLPEIHVRNLNDRSEMTVPKTKVRDNEAEITLKGLNAGINRISVGRVRIYGIFGSLYFPLRYPLQCEISVYPAACTLNPGNLRQRSIVSEGDVMMEKGDDYHELYEIRPFEEGDDLRHLHRSLSARYGDYIIKVGSGQRHLLFTFMLKDEKEFARMKQELGQLYSLCQQVIGKNSDGFLLTYRGQDRQIYAWTQFYDFIDGVYRRYV